MMKAIKSVFALLLAVAMVMSIAACAPGEDAKGEKIVMNVALSGDPVMIDPAFGYDNDTSVVVEQISEGLLGQDENNNLICILCESWEEVDPTTYVYTLRQDVTFSDGNPMTADDVVYSLSRHMDDSLGSLMGWMFGGVASIEKTGDYEVTVKLTEPDPNWKFVLSTNAGKVIEKGYAEGKGTELGTAAGGLIGTGPFVFESWETGSKIVLSKNKNYWNKNATTNIDEIVFSIVSDDTTLLTALQNGQIDFCVNFSTTLVESIAELKNVTLFRNQAMGVHFMAFNCEREPFNDVNVRQAISYAIDAQAIHDNIYKTTGDVGTRMPVPASLFNIEREKWETYVETVPAYECNIEKAKEYMAKSSVPDGFSCNLVVNESNALRYNASLVIQESLKAIGIDVEIKLVSASESISYQIGGKLDENGVRDYDMLLASWGADYPDASGTLNPLYLSTSTGEGGSNSAQYSNAELDAILIASNASTNPSERVDLMLDACSIIINEIPYYIYNYSIMFAVAGSDYTIPSNMNMISTWDWCFRDVVYVGE